MKEQSLKYQSLFPAWDKQLWSTVWKNIGRISEIRIRAGQPVFIYLDRTEVSIDGEGQFIYTVEKGYRFSYQKIQEMIDFWCMDSRYAFQNEIRNGFLTIEGGHRIGICGEVVNDFEGKVQSIKYISAVNIRVAHEVKHTADAIMKYIRKEKGIENTLIVSPPGAGKTTLLRDIVRQLSDGSEEYLGVNVGLVDERGEIAACFQGIPQLEVGKRTDVLDQCGKAVGMRMLLRTMTPAVIAVDELGSPEEIQWIRQMTGNGCAVIATIHGSSLEELKTKKMLQEIWAEDVFKNKIYLSRDRNGYHMYLYQGKDDRLCYSS